MKYLIVDAALSGTGIRDYYNGGYINLEDLKLNSNLIKEINVWVSKYADEFYNQFSNDEVVDKLDKEGKEIATKVKKELPGIKVEYYSNAKMKKGEI